MAKLLLFGASGAIGKVIAKTVDEDFKIIGAGRKITPELKIAYQGTGDKTEAEILAQHGPYDAVCWAQGANINDSVYNFDAQKHLEIYHANCLFILNSLNQLLTHNLLAKSARLVVISSIWQNIARQDKLSYTVSKSALQGLIHSAAIDLGRDGHLINAILPGVLETPMTRLNLTSEQIEKVESATLFKRLATLEDVASLAAYLLSPRNTGITGQFISADLGFSNARFI